MPGTIPDANPGRAGSSLCPALRGAAFFFTYGMAFVEATGEAAAPRAAERLARQGRACADGYQNWLKLYVPFTCKW